MYFFYYLAAPGAGPTTESNSFTAATTIEKTIQSAVWTYDSETNELKPTWINSDGSECSFIPNAKTPNV
jgi:hypothetical protein